jgi:uncharacterized protein
MLTFPLILAAMTAGAIGGVHCVGMCGGISTLLTQHGQRVIPIVQAKADESVMASTQLRYQILLQSGRITTYALIGAFMGGIGAMGLMLKPYLPVQQALYLLGNLALLMLGLRLLGYLPELGVAARLGAALSAISTRVTPRILASKRYPFLIGMTWGLLPCGLLFGVSPFALLSGTAWSGAVLMIVFGVCALPHLLFAQRLALLSKTSVALRGFRLVAAGLLLAIAIFGLWHADMRSMPAFLCVTPA